jgi:glycosyltransferase involved in cell wall biosynthesis
MYIGIDTCFLRPGRIGGSETYTRSLIAALGRLDHQNHYHLFTTPINQSLFASLPSNFYIYSTRYTKSLRELDLIHFPGTTIQPLSLPFPTIITIHDLQHLYWPGFFSLRERLRRWRQDRPSIHKAAHIIAISDFTRRTIAEKFPSAAAKVTTIHSGVSAEFFQPVPQATKERLRQKYNLPPQFGLYPARPWPHKNHKRLFAVMQILKEQYQSDCRLLLCGFNHDEIPSNWQPLLDSLGDDTVQLVSYLPKEEMPVLYQTADFLIYPSLFEGFGLPVLEAMAARCPVICANSTALPEIAGDAAVLVDPYDSAALAQAMHALLTNPTQRAELIERGVERAKAFSWEKTAQATLNIYEQVTGTWQVPVTLMK